MWRGPGKPPHPRLSSQPLSVLCRPAVPPTPVVGSGLQQLQGVQQRRCSVFDLSGGPSLTHCGQMPTLSQSGDHLCGRKWCSVEHSALITMCLRLEERAAEGRGEVVGPASWWGFPWQASTRSGQCCGQGSQGTSCGSPCASPQAMGCNCIYVVIVYTL